MQVIKDILKDYELNNIKSRVNIFDIINMWQILEKQKYEKRNNQKATAPKTSK